MAALLRKILPVVPSCPKDDDVDDDNNIEYSFAIEYRGPPMAYDIPRAVPVDVDEIPTAETVSSSSVLNVISLPVIQPLVKIAPLKKEPAEESRLGSNLTCSAGSMTESVVQLSGDGVAHESWSPSSMRMDSSGALACENADACSHSLSDEIVISGKLRSSDGLDHLLQLPGSSEIIELPDDRQSEEFQDYMKPDVNPANSESTESGMSSRAFSSEVFSCNGEDGNNGTPCHVKRPSNVTFCDPESSDTVQEESDYSESESVLEMPKAERKGKKGSCYRCLMGNRFTEKEICIVCDAKYCSKCVLRAMGSMPEGRKCVACIGKRINESRRGTLGKCSRMLRWLLSELEIKQIMSSEISCQVNQLPSQLIYVNGERLSPEELFLLQTCPYPPKRLKPGCYWYDKVSGCWGKEGEKPCQVISNQLDIGGSIKRNASNGNTNVFMNNREITKVELLMLQVAGVQCEGKPHFWVSADGSYSEEGQKNIKGRIWDNARAKLACAILNLPTPPDPVKLSGEQADNVITINHLEQKTLKKLLLVGYEKSGTSTLYKQAKLLYNVPFSEDERENVKLMIQTNLYCYLGFLLEGRERFEAECLILNRKRQFDGHSGSKDLIDKKTMYSISPKLKAFSDWLLKVMASGNLEAIFPAANREYAPYIEALWEDAAIQATYNRRDELEMLPRVAAYFLERAAEISSTDYVPSDMDMLYAEGLTSSNGLSAMEFSFPNSAQQSSLDLFYQHDPLLRYQLIRVHPRSLGENCKWLEMFEDADGVVFCVSLTDYDEFSEDNNGVPINKMMASKQLFERFITHPAFIYKKILLILNKFDLFQEKIEHVPLSKCEWFHEFNPVISHNHNPSLAQRAFHYIAVKFKRLFHSLTDHRVKNNRKITHNLFVSQVTGTEPDSVDQALRYMRDILTWQIEEQTANEISTSMDASTTS